MRYRFIALVAVIAMIAGVFGIYTTRSGNDESEKQKEIAAQQAARMTSVYFNYNAALSKGLLLGEGSVSQKTATYTATSRPQWLNDAITLEEFSSLQANGAVLVHAVKSDDLIKRGDLIPLKSYLKDNYTLVPVKIIPASQENPDFEDAKFIDLLLITNDNTPFNSNFYDDDYSGPKESYTRTRVKCFSKNVLLFSRDLSNQPATTDNNSSASEKKTSAESATNKLIYAYFRKEDVAKVIQAQLIGTFFAEPVKNANLNNGISVINEHSPEIMPSDIVSGAPVAEQFGQIKQIRGARQ